MPFESFLHKTETKRGKLFHATVVFSVLAHAGALSWATVKSLTVVEELPAPSVKLSFLHAPVMAPAPAPAPPAAKPPEPEGGGKAASPTPRAHQALRPHLRRRPDTVVKDTLPATVVPVESPQESPPSTPADVAAAPAAGPPAGSGSPSAGGGAVAGAGTGAGAGSSPGRGTGIGGGGGGPPRILPEALGRMQRLSGTAPTFPAQLAKQGAQFIVMTKVCVNASGAVDAVDVMKRADPLLDTTVVEAVRRWRYKPLMAGGTAVPFCTFVRFEFTTHT